MTAKGPTVVMVVGRVNQGKTALVSTLTRNNHLSEKKDCCQKTYRWYPENEGEWWIVDTPGFGSLSYSDEKVMTTIKRKANGIDHVNAFIYVMNCSKRITDYEIVTLNLLESQFEDFLKSTVFVFTHGDIYPGLLTQDFIERFPETFRDKVKEADNRVVVIDNKPKNDDNNTKIKLIQDFIKNIVEGTKVYQLEMVVSA
ncbi:uncharacterized protein LOC106179627 isoform X2 [Lingula anatina]|uniref:Uncharacterized protein LOC106179627 isoform X2 n=1 Tax=Lingula anatina TaxID=7574 RepID=A0A1S3K842_LINAN|nr:uncharacterized protein LOC106179627 isoform X2 [Lingula anatina]|eukprot:XP_013418798.1 uncharacterized protein LOC106179627 isoform X2 [Lingula anatina]